MSDYKGIRKLDKVGSGFKTWQLMVKGHLASVKADDSATLWDVVDTTSPHAKDLTILST
jgi:hypothetical protein